ncbi:hypothetical protein PVAND_011964 [Polypedilum vanderplanki]|uniref:Uncharacterized protein n=1 Tax=Polypedilum vanderplanki TaxID=319348 RepID=A0A9J6CLZ0_POLVA|nr:hypothetical protein PVAND_011964 [Polypedilum vanderplanki]
MKIQLFFIILTVCGSNKFTQQELLSFIQASNSEYLKTNSYAKFEYNFNRPKIVKVKNGIFTMKNIDDIRKAKFGVILQIEYQNNDNSDDETDIEDYELERKKMIDFLEVAQKPRNIFSEEYVESEFYDKEKCQLENNVNENYENDDNESYQFESD